MKNTQKGFTLVELLVVIAILAILAGVGVVGYTAYMENAKVSVAQQELNQLKDYITADDILDTEFDLSTMTEAQLDAYVTECKLEGDATIANGVVTYTAKDSTTAKAYWVIATGKVTTTAP